MYIFRRQTKGIFREKIWWNMATPVSRRILFCHAKNANEFQRGVQRWRDQGMDGGEVTREDYRMTCRGRKGKGMQIKKKKRKTEQRICTKGVGWSLVHEDWLWKATMHPFIISHHPLLSPFTPALTLLLLRQGIRCNILYLDFFFYILLICSPYMVLLI